MTTADVNEGSTDVAAWAGVAMTHAAWVIVTTFTLAVPVLGYAGPDAAGMSFLMGLVALTLGSLAMSWVRYRSGRGDDRRLHRLVERKPLVWEQLAGWAWLAGWLSWAVVSEEPDPTPTYFVALGVMLLAIEARLAHATVRAWRSAKTDRDALGDA